VAAAGSAFSKIPALGLRIKTEIKGFPGSRTQTAAAAGPSCPFLPALGSRPETEFIGFAGNRARTANGGCCQPAGVRFPVRLHKKGCFATAEQPFFST